MKKILLFLLVLGFVACSPIEKDFLRSYVMYYNGAGEMSLDGEVVPELVVIRIGFVHPSALGGYKSTGELKKSYDALCEKHGDMTFNRKVVVWAGSAGSRSTTNLGIDFVSIEIVSDTDFDVEHPIGESLGDIVRFNSYSLKPYIDSGYKSESEGSVYHPVSGLISELTSEELILLGRDNYVGSLVFESLPTLSKTHTFTVTMTADDGRVFSDSIEMTFE